MSHCTLTVLALAERVLARAKPDFCAAFLQFQEELRNDVAAATATKKARQLSRPTPKLHDEVVLTLTSLMREELNQTKELVSLYGYAKTFDGLHFASSARRVVLHLSEDFDAAGLEGMTHRQDWTERFLQIAA